MVKHKAHSVKLDNIRFTVAVQEETTADERTTLTLVCVYLQDSSKDLLPLLSAETKQDIVSEVWRSITQLEEK